MDTAQKRIAKRLAECEKTIGEFTNPFPGPEDYSDNVQYALARLEHIEAHSTGRFTLKNIQKVHDLKRRLMGEQSDLINFRFGWDRHRNGGRK